VRWRFYVAQPTFLFPLETPLQQSRNMLHGLKDNAMLAKPLAACTYLSLTVSQLFEQQVQKIGVFTYCRPHFCFPWRRPCDYHAICCTDGKTIQCLPNPSQHVLIYLQQFPSYSMLKSMRKSKNLFFTTFLFFFLGRPWGNHAICCMVEREFDAYKLSRCMCPSNCNRF